MKSLEESVVTSMDGADVRILPYLPYILQDSWEIGTSPEIVIELTKKHAGNYENLRVLDLGCGKGAVSVKLARALGCRCHGIDAVPEFIRTAREKAREFGVEALCVFEEGDIREEALHLRNYDIIVLGSIGPVLGDHHAALTTLAGCLSPDGIVILDDGYVEDDGGFSHPEAPPRGMVMDRIHEAGMHVAGEVVISKDAMRKMDEDIFKPLERRCRELAETHPDMKDLFEDYIRRQREENEALETHIVCSTMVVKNGPAPHVCFEGVRHFNRREFGKYAALFQRLGRKQNPHTLFIGCSDSRVVPNMITTTLPGDLFVIRNIANVVPYYRSSAEYLATTSAVEYAVLVLEVKNIVVCGHSNCGGCRALFLRDEELDRIPHTRKWLDLVRNAKVRAEENLSGPVERDKLELLVEQENIVEQMNNLLTYPFIEERFTRGEIKIFGWYYEIGTGTVYNYNSDTKLFEKIE